MNSSKHHSAMAQHNPSSSVFKVETAPGGVAPTNDESARRYCGKCQYKTGKCFNERTLKRNGEAHSLCEEHRVKQNLIQRRSDRKYQTVHALRRRERSQRRAVLKKQVSMAVAQQLFFEHQQQKTLGIPLPQDHPLHLLVVNANGETSAMSGGTKTTTSAPFQARLPPSASCPERGDVVPAIASHCPASVEIKGSYTGASDTLTAQAVNNSTSSSFQDISVPLSHSLTASKGQKVVCSRISDNFGYMPTASVKETWSDDDIEFLHTVLLT